jgi:hypothetical protein
VVEVAVELPHGEVEFAAYLADRLFDGLRIIFIRNGMLFDESADFTVELVLRIDDFDPVTGLVEAGIA